jgi:hypothetical protein
MVEDSGAVTTYGHSILVKPRPKFHLSTGPMQTVDGSRRMSLRFGVEGGSHSLADGFDVFIDGKLEGIHVKCEWLYLD